MKSDMLGRDTSEVEVTQISSEGIWLLLGTKDHFLSFENFPWFKGAATTAVHKVELLSPNHLCWPELDIDISVESIENPETFPLISRQRLS